MQENPRMAVACWLAAMACLSACTLLQAAEAAAMQSDAGVQTMFYKARSGQTGNMWDTWLYLHDGAYHLYYLAKSQAQWDNISMATSPDGVHWKKIGRVLSKGPGVTWMGTGSTWKSPNFEKDGKFFMNFSEWKGPRQTIFFAESKDLIHWTRLGGEHEFVQDELWYENNGRWDCIWTIPRPGGELFNGLCAAKTKMPDPSRSINNPAWLGKTIWAIRDPFLRFKR